MNIDEMPAGPDMDWAIAEKVMGWRVNHVNAAGVCTPGRYEEFSPSTNSTHSDEVVVRLVDLGFEVRERQYGPRGSLPSVPSSCEIYRVKTLVAESTECSSAPLAICRAALKAMEQR